MGGDVMHRTQVILEDKHYEFLKELSNRENKSISKTLRSIIDDYSEKTGVFSLSSIAGIGKDPDARGKDHDKVLYNKK